MQLKPFNISGYTTALTPIPDGEGSGMKMNLERYHFNKIKKKIVGEVNWIAQGKSTTYKIKKLDAFLLKP